MNINLNYQKIYNFLRNVLLKKYIINNFNIYIYIYK